MIVPKPYTLNPNPISKRHAAAFAIFVVGFQANHRPDVDVRPLALIQMGVSEKLGYLRVHLKGYYKGT